MWSPESFRAALLVSKPVCLPLFDLQESSDTVPTLQFTLLLQMNSPSAIDALVLASFSRFPRKFKLAIVTRHKFKKMSKTTPRSTFPITARHRTNDCSSSLKLKLDPGYFRYRRAYLHSRNDLPFRSWSGWYWGKCGAATGTLKFWHPLWRRMKTKCPSLVCPFLSSSSAS